MLFDNAIRMRPGVMIAGTLPFGETRDTEVIVVAGLMRASNANLAAQTTISQFNAQECLL